MATSGFTDVVATKTSSGKTADTLRFSWTRTGYSIADNTSTIYWELKLIAGTYGAISSSAAKSWSVNVNGTPYSGTNTVGISANTTKVLASGTTTISHNSDGNKTFSYSFSQYFGISFNGSIGTVSGSGSGTLDNIPRKATVLTGTDFTDVKNPTITYSNPAGTAVTLKACISLTGQIDDIKYRTIPNNKDSYTFPLTAAEIDLLCKATLNGSDYRSIKFVIATYDLNGNVLDTHGIDRRFTVTDCEPTLLPTVIDKGDISYTLTNDRSKFIRYFNYPYAEFNAVGKKGASIVSRIAICGNQRLEASGNYVQFNNIDGDSIEFIVTDNRGKSTRIAYPITYIEYRTLTCMSSIDKDINGETADINFTVTGDYFSGSFGAKSNTLTVEYRYKTGSTEYPEEWTPLTATPADGKYTATGSITGLDYKSTYTLQFRAKDAVYTWGINAKEEIVKFIPVYDWGENDFNFNVPVTIQGRNVSTHSMARAYTQEENISYADKSYIKLFREGSPTDLYDQSIATFNENGTITINKDMIALINVHLIAYNNNSNNRSWIKLWNYNEGRQYTASINYGLWTTPQFNIVLKLAKNSIIGLVTTEAIILNSGGPTGSYIEIIEL